MPDMLSRVVIKAPCKINLTLDVIGKREDGYHFLEMIMQSIDLCDKVTITRNGGKDINISCTNSDIETDDTNLAYIAADVFFKTTFLERVGLDINIEKAIPIQAGLGGGSADGAAVLVGLNKLFEMDLPQNELCEMGIRVGADVPFCILGGTAMAEGIGEIFTPLPDLPDCFIVIAKPQTGISTMESFRRIDTLGANIIPDTEKIVAAIICGNLEEIAGEMVNVLEEAAQLKEIADYKKMMLANGALGAVMTGSGSAVIGLFESKFRAKHCYKKFRGIAKSVFIAKPISHGAVVESFKTHVL